MVCGFSDQDLLSAHVQCVWLWNIIVFSLDYLPDHLCPFRRGPIIPTIEGNPLPPGESPMNTNLRIQHPAQAVCYHAQSMGPDGDGRGTAGPPLAGVGAASSLRFNSRGQSSEIPFHGSYNWRLPRTNSKPTMYSPSR